MSRVLVAFCALALAGCPTVDLGDTPPDIGACNPNGGIDSFTNMIWPQFLHPSGAKDCAQSAGCHLKAHGLTLDPGPPVDYAANLRIAQQYLNCGTPTASQLLTKPLAGVDGHGGGDLIQPGDAEYTVFINWFK